MKTLVAYVPGRNNYDFSFLPKYQGEKVNFIEEDKANRISNFNLFKEKLAFAREEGYNNLSIVGYGEPLLNRSYIEMIDTLNNQLTNPFSCVELKTNGSSIMKEGSTDLDFLSGTKIKTIVVYLSSFEDHKHHQMMTGGSSIEPKTNITVLCEKIKEYGYNLRLELIGTKWFEHMSLDDIIRNVRQLKPDQVTLCQMQLIDTSIDGGDINNWIRLNSWQQSTVSRIQETLKEFTPIGITSNGYNIYSFGNISFVLNDGQKLSEEFNSMYLLPNARLYRQPDDLGSLIF